MTLHRIVYGREAPGNQTVYLVTTEGLQYQGVLVPVEPDRGKLFDAFQYCEQHELISQQEVEDRLLAALGMGPGVGEETP